MSLRELCNNFNREKYNGLMSIEAAGETVRVSNQLDDFLRAAANLFVHYHMHDRFGVGLLHKHNTCEPGERMIQYDRTVHDEKALVTLPIRKDADLREEVPNVWALSDRTFVPLEYTTDQCARDAFHAGDVPAEFLTGFADLTEASPVGSLFGLAIVKRALAQAADESQVLLEYSDPVERQNVVFLRRRDEAKNSITTAWTFEEYARSDRITAETECVATQRCQCIVDDPDHPGYPPKHSHVPRPHHIQRPA